MKKSLSNPDQNQTCAAETLVFGGTWYENAELHALPKLLEGVRTFVDVGASFGPYTKCANDTMRDSKIIAVEANRQTFERLAKNCGSSATSVYRGCHRE